MSERRNQNRQKSFLGATVALNKRFTTFDAIVRNLSEGGAMLTLAEAERLPEEFDLEIESAGIVAHARAVWRAPGRIGVTLQARETQAAAGAGRETVGHEAARLEGPRYETWDLAALIERVRALEHENARLRQRVLQLTETGI